MRGKKIRKVVVIMLIIISTTTLLYNIYDNNRVIVKEQDVVIDKLPYSFDGFKILQITDLHGKSFGENQSKLTSLINTLDYDMIAITGDMGNTRTGDPEPLYKLLDGIENKELVVNVDGNVGPWTNNEFTGEITEEGKCLQDKGVIILTEPYSIKRGNDTLWISNELSESNLNEEIPREFFDSDSDYNSNREYFNKLEKVFNEINESDSVKILLSHYPKAKSNFEPKNIKEFGHLEYHLSIAGHYHGGQFRIPFIGALYTPDPLSKTKGFFQKQNEVSGLNKYYDTQQYISAGLGASSGIKPLGFRLFNTPEINVITLKNRN